MLGQEVPIGTGSVELVFDEESFGIWRQERKKHLEERIDSKSDSIEEIPVESSCTIASLMDDF